MIQSPIGLDKLTCTGLEMIAGAASALIGEALLRGGMSQWLAAFQVVVCKTTGPQMTRTTAVGEKLCYIETIKGFGE